jgi:hypothetical protein
MGYFKNGVRMKMIKVVFFLLLIILNFSAKCYANAFSTEANFIQRNKVEISIIDSFLFKGNYMLQEKEFVAYSLIQYKNEEAIKLLKKMLNDSKPEFQSIAIMPLINAGEFDIAFNKFKQLIQLNEKEVLINFYKGNTMGKFEETKRSVYKSYKDQFIPYFKSLCNNDSISYLIKYHASNTLFFLGIKGYLKPICNEILSRIPDSNKKPSERTEEENQNWHLRKKAEFSLKRIENEKE